MEIFDETVKALTKAGIMVILNNHTSKSQWCCTPWDGDGLWYTE
jgi:endoglucanase